MINVAVLAVFAMLFLARRNYEFIVYALSLGVVIWLIEKTGRTVRYSRMARFGFSVWMALHLGAGAFYVNGQRIYDTMLATVFGEPYNILRFDQAIHVFCYFVVALFVHSIVRHIGGKEGGAVVRYVIVALSAMGISAMNEVIEFATVVFFDAQGVGGYYNNALDLVFNLIGILAAVGLCAATSPRANASTGGA